MAADLPESDWKAFRKLRELALERLCQRILADVDRITSDSTRTPHARFLALYGLIQERDDQIAHAFNNPRRSAAIAQLVAMVSLDLVSKEELMSFSPRTQTVVEAWLQSGKRARAAKGA